MAEKTLLIQALLEGAYAQTPTLPGNFVKYDDFCARFNTLIQENDFPLIDVEKNISELYPEAKHEQNYQLQDSADVFHAFRIAPNRLKFISEIKSKIEKIFKISMSDNEGWIPFASIGNQIDKEDYQKLGFISLKQTMECIFGKRMEFRRGDVTKHEAPLQVRDLKMIGSEGLFEKKEKNPVKNFRLKQGSYLGNALDSFAFFPRPKDAAIKGWDAAVNFLATNLALEERWYYDDDDKMSRPILKNYLSYTFERLQYEDGIEREKAEREKRPPKLKIFENDKNAVWNTGLVDNIYDPIYAFFERNDGRNSSIKQDWIFIAFNTANSSHQRIMSKFSGKPEKASYFNDPRELLYDSRATKPTLDWNHFLKDNISRLPIGFIKKGFSECFDFIETPNDLPKLQRDAYYKKLAEAIFSNEDWKQFLTTRFKNAVDVALSRVEWNYKTAIPVYYPTEKKLQLLLPLALEEKKHIDVALVCNHIYMDNGKVNNYEGRTIFTLEMAYNNARLITRPDSDWLMADMCRG